MSAEGMKSVLEKLEALGRRYQELEQLMAQPEVVLDYQRMQEIAKERATLEELVKMHRQYKDTWRELEGVLILLEEEPQGEMVALAEEEREGLQKRLEELQQKIRLALLPRDPKDEKDVIVEVRAGAGGEEASLFAADLFRMYSQYALSKGWKVDVIDANQTGIGGLKEIVFEVRGKGAFSRLRHERGVHRVQRVPSTETSGRLHTSTATVAVLPEAEDVDLNIGPEDLRIDVFRAGGHGGQSVNKVASAVRITHIPTGITASCQDERSQVKNKSKAMAVLKARVLDRELQRHQQEISAERRSQVGGGERSEKIRTYNFPQDRVSDHRINLTLHGLERIMGGELDELIGALISYEQSSQLEQVVA